MLGLPSISLVVIVAEVGPLSGKGPELNRCLVDVDHFSDHGSVREHTLGVPLKAGAF